MTLLNGTFTAITVRILTALLIAAPSNASAGASEGGGEPSALEDSSSGATDSRTSGGPAPRSVLGFATEAVVTPGLWVEIGEAYRQEYSSWRTSALAAYGWRDWEFGGEISVFSSGNFRNLGLWAKYAGWDIGPANVGAGLLTEIPTSYGNFEAAPFVSTSVPVAEWDLRASLGYVITHDFLYEAACLRPIADWGDVRVELAGEFDPAFGYGSVQVLPGFDFHFVYGGWRILTRMSVGAEVHPGQGALANLSFVLTEV